MKKFNTTGKCIAFKTPDYFHGETDLKPTPICGQKADCIIVDDLVPLPTKENDAIKEKYWNQYYGVTPEQQGIKPMAYNNSPTSAATSVQINATAPKSDAQTQREYLLERLDGLKSRWEDVPGDITRQLRKQFNIDAPSFFSKPQDLIDAIKNGKFTVDQKRVDRVNAEVADYDDEDEDGSYDPWMHRSALSFITFTDLPKADSKGYRAALEAYAKAYQSTKDTIMGFDYPTALAALQALESWTYTPPTLH